MSVRTSIFLSAIAAVAFSSAAQASWVLSNSNGGDGYYTTTATGYDLFGADNGVGGNLTTLTNVAATSGTLAFNYSYTTNDCCGSIYDPAGYVIDGVLTQLSIDGFAGGQVNSTGVATFAVTAGQSYGFYVYSTDSILGRGDIAFSSAAPEASTWAMMLLGFAGLGFAGYRSARKSGAAAA